MGNQLVACVLVVLHGKQKQLLFFNIVKERTYALSISFKDAFIVVAVITL